MNNAWTIEISRIVIVTISVILFGFVSAEWWLAILLPCSVYIIWLLVQIRTLERWIRLGAKNNLAPDSNGIWQLIVQHIAQLQRKNSERKARLSFMASRFEATIAALPDATVVISANKEIELTNQAAEELFGIKKKTDIGLRLDNLIRNPRLQQLIDSADSPAVAQIESPLDRRKTLSVTCVDFGEEQKLITARDISQRIAVQTLRKAFIANASHELRTPLTVISGYLEILESEPGLSETVRKQISNATQQAIRMQRILNDLLTLTKLEEKGYDENSGDIVDMPSLIERMVADFETTKTKGSHHFIMEIDSSLFIRAIENELFSLCQNLLSNAVKYSADGSTIIIQWEKDRLGQLCLCVVDDGEGVAPEDISRLTERFYRVNIVRSRQVGGTGLGLSIVKHILENHGGYLDIKSQLGKGSKFTACFPTFRAAESSGLVKNSSR